MFQLKFEIYFNQINIMKKTIIIMSATYLMLACGDNSKKEIQEAKILAIDSMKMEAQIKNAKQEVIDSMKIEAKVETAKQFTRDSLKDAKKPKLYSERKISKSSPDSYVSTSSTPPPVTTSTKRKRKISRPVQGALIGAGVGAVSGAIINKNDRGKGAIIGGIIGAGVGAGTGVVIDNNQKKKGN